MSFSHFAAATLVVGCGAVLQGSIGFGLGVFSVPFLLLIEPRLIPGPLLSASLLLTLLLTHRERDGVRLGDLKWALGGRVVGVVAALGVLSYAPERWIGIGFGVLVLAAVGLSASGLHVVPAPRTLAGAGTLSGFMATLVSIGGPPMALLYQRESGAHIRGTLSAFFTIGVGMSLVGLGLVGRYGLTEFRLALALAPGIVIGFLLSRVTSAALDRGYTRVAVLAISAATALVTILREVL